MCETAYQTSEICSRLLVSVCQQLNSTSVISGVPGNPRCNSVSVHVNPRMNSVAACLLFQIALYTRWRRKQRATASVSQLYTWPYIYLLTPDSIFFHRNTQQ